MHDDAVLDDEGSDVMGGGVDVSTTRVHVGTRMCSKQGSQPCCKNNSNGCSGRRPRTPKHDTAAAAPASAVRMRARHPVGTDLTVCPRVSTCVYVPSFDFLDSLQLATTW